MKNNQTDVLIIGGGHNGLVCAAYLAKAGKKVTILEKREIVGGAAVTEEFHPGFKNSTASYTVSLLNPKIIRDLHLEKHGLKIKLRPQSNIFLHPNDDSLSFYGTEQETQAEIARFSKKDAEALPGFYRMLETIADLLREELLRTPPNVGGGLMDMIRAGSFGLRAKKLTMSERRDAMDMFAKSATDVLDAWFENDHVKAAFAFDSIVGNYGAPSTPGSAYVLLHHVFGEANGVQGAWGHAIGGMGAITSAMRKEAELRGVEILTDKAVEEVIIEHGQAKGVRLEDGTSLYASKVVSNVGPKLLYGSMVADEHLEAEFIRRVRGFKVGSGTFRMNVALSELPDLKARPGTNLQKHHQSGIVIGPTLKYMEQAYFDAKQFGWSKDPIVEILIPSTVDSTLAPEGQHVAVCFVSSLHQSLMMVKAGMTTEKRSPI